MDEPGDDTDREFVQAQESFGVSLLRNARQQVRTRPPAAAGQQPDTRVLDAASEALDQLIDHLGALPEDQQTEAVTMIAFGMILEHLRLATSPPPVRDRS